MVLRCLPDGSAAMNTSMGQTSRALHPASVISHLYAASVLRADLCSPKFMCCSPDAQHLVRGPDLDTGSLESVKLKWSPEGGVFIRGARTQAPRGTTVGGHKEKTQVWEPGERPQEEPTLPPL